MMRTLKPVAALDKLVDYMWLADVGVGAEDSREDIIMPLGHINIIFNYGSAYCLVEGNQKIPIPDRAVIGQIKRAKRVLYGQSLYQIGISLTPLGFIKLFSMPSFHLTERFVQASDVDSGLEALYSIREEYAQPEQHFAAIQHYLLHKLALNKQDTARIEAMLDYVERECGSLNVGDMARCFAISVSALGRSFKQQVGLTPKAYGDIVRFKRHVEGERLRNGNGMQHQYYDQSHLLKATKRFAGKTVGELKRLPPELTLSYLWR